jgi:hypothetical protein
MRCSHCGWLQGRSGCGCGGLPSRSVTAMHMMTFVIERCKVKRAKSTGVAEGLLLNIDSRGHFGWGLTLNARDSVGQDGLLSSIASPADSASCPVFKQLRRRRLANLWPDDFLATPFKVPSRPTSSGMRTLSRSSRGITRRPAMSVMLVLLFCVGSAFCLTFSAEGNLEGRHRRDSPTKKRACARCDWKVRCAARGGLGNSAAQNAFNQT